VSLMDDWLGSIWGVGPDVSSPRPSIDRVPPECRAAAVWLKALWGFSI
jgi:hypothetical protein